MAKSCSYIPTRKGEPLEGWYDYKKAFGYEKAIDVFSISIAPSYIEENKKILELDAQGVPTLESTLRTPRMKKFLSEASRMEALEKEFNFKMYDNNDDNYRMLVNDAKNFNSQNNDFIAYVETTDRGIKVSLHPKSEKALKTFNDQYGSMILNDRLQDIFGDIGVTVGVLEKAESSSGITDFSKAKAIAGQFSDLIKVAKGMAGQMAMSEEFSHLIIEVFKDRPIVNRLLNYLENNPSEMQKILGDDYNEYVSLNTDNDGEINYRGVAEECAGRLMQQSLLRQVGKESGSYADSLNNRAVKTIQSEVRNKNEREVDNAIIEANQELDDLAKAILSGDEQISQSDVEKTFSEKRLHHLEKTVDDLSDVVDKAIITEAKKSKIFRSDTLLDEVKKRKAILDAVVNKSPEGQLKGILNYAKAALNDLRQTELALKKASMDDGNVFGLLRSARMTIQSYSPFIEQLGALLRSSNQELENLLAETTIKNPDETIDSLNSLFQGLNSLKSQVEGRFTDLAIGSFENFLKPFFDLQGQAFKDKNGKTVTLREAIEEANGDIGLIDRYLQTMSTSGDIILQMFEAVVAKAKNRAKMSTIDEIRDIIRLQMEAKEDGLTDFEFMFEHDSEGHKTGNYISEVNYGQYEKDRKEFLDSLDEKYGVNPRGKDSILKARERREWYKTHAAGRLNNDVPNATLYHNSEYDRLSNKQKEFIRKYKELKNKMDRRYPPNKVDKNKAIQRRRDRVQRAIDLTKNPSSVFDAVKESFKQDFATVADDDQMFGQKTGLTDFSGKEHMVLPVLYTRSLSNPDELSTDVFSALSAYSYASNTYAELDKVVDPLEIGRAIVGEVRNTAKVSNGKPIVEKLGKGGKILSKVFQSGGSNVEAKLQDFMESQIYGRYYKDSDKTIKIGKANVKANKALQKWLRISSMAQLGFNWLANSANVATGIGMQNIEAAAGQFFNGKELASADAAYLEQLKDFLPEMESNNQTSKLALFDELFDVKQDFRDKVGRSRQNSLLKRLFGETLAYLGQTCGDHWLYNRTAIAMAKRQKVVVNGETMSLWDALQIENKFKDNDKIKVLRLPKGTKDADTGKLIDQDWIGQFSAKIKYVNHHLFGVYNSDDMVAAERTAAGRALLQYRKWIVPQFSARFGEKRYIMAIQDYREGYYRTLLNMCIGLKEAQGNIARVWDELEDYEKANVRRAAMELFQFTVVWALANFVLNGADKDPDKLWIMKYAEYMAQRELHELGNLTPSLTMGREILKTAQSPANIISTLQSTLNLVGSIVDPRDWNNELQSGPYEGHSTLFKNIMKAPIPIIPQINQGRRLIDGIEDATQFYIRNY